MADLNIQLILRLVDKATAPARAAMRAIERIGGEGMLRQAERVSRGSRMMASGLGSITGAALRGTAVIAGYTGSVSLLAGLFVGPAAEMERFKVQLTNLEGSSQGADKALRWIRDFATRTPLELNDTVAAYARLKAFGLDPTNGSLQALVDTMAASGGGAEQLDGLVLALGQSWTKGKLQGEEAMQMLERGVPVWDLLAAKMGKTTSEVMKMSEQGKLGRQEIQLLVDALGERNAGASENMSKTWDGITSNLSDQWYGFRTMVMDSGVFDYLKQELREFLDLINQMAADGRLQAIADQVAQFLLSSLQAIVAFGHQVVAAWNAIVPIIASVAEMLGGWDRLAWFAAALVMSQTIWGLISGFWTFGQGLLLVSTGLLGMAGQAMLATSILARIGLLMRTGLIRGFGLLKSGLLMIGGAFQWLGRILMITGRAMLANPLVLVLTTIAGLAYVIYRNWDGIVAYFQGKIDRVRAAFDEGLLNGVLKLLSEFNPFVLMMDAAEGLFTFITGWTFGDVRKAIAEAFGFDPFTAIYNAADRFFTFVTGWSFADVTAAVQAAFDIDLYQMGVDMMNSLWEGIKAVIGQLTAWVKTQLDSIMPDWMKSGSIGGNSGYDGMGGAMDGNPALDGQRALGGPVRAGMIYRWQEEGRELFVPRTDGNVISNRQLRGMQTVAAGARGGLNIGGITIHAAPGQTPADIARAVRRELELLARQKAFALHDGGDFD